MVDGGGGVNGGVVAGPCARGITPPPSPQTPPQPPPLHPYRNERLLRDKLVGPPLGLLHISAHAVV